MFLVQIPWRCYKCGLNGVSQAARKRHEEIHQEEFEREQRAVAMVNAFSENVVSSKEPPATPVTRELSRLSVELARKQRAYDDARKAFFKYVRNRKNAL